MVRIKKAASFSSMVLVIADTPERLAALNQSLVSLRAEIYPTYCLKEISTLIKKHEFAVILIDSPGSEAAYLIRKQGLNSNTPLLFVTQMNDKVSTMEKSLSLSPIDYVFMPLDPLILTCKITMLCDLYCREKKLKNLLQENMGVRKKLENKNKRLDKLAYHDLLTNLPNRLQFERKIESAIAASKRHSRGFALLLIDLDDFKSINDTHGHAMGDLLLQAVSSKLQKCFRKNDLVTMFGPDSIVSRLGGDEFAIILSELKGTDDAGIAAKRALSKISGRYHLAEKNIHTSASIGIACYPEAGCDLATLYEHADTAMYAAKDQGKNRYRYYTPKLDERHHKNLRIHNSIKLAMKQNSLGLDYLPIYQLKDREIVGIEAQINCQLDGVNKTELLSASEKSGLASPVIEWALQEAFYQQKQWHQSGYTNHFLSVNLSSKQFDKGDLSKTIAKLANKNKSLIKSIHLELSETALMVDLINHEKALSNLKKSGFSLSIDKFGVSNSSLLRIKELSVHTVKIDKSLIKNIDSNPTNTIIVKSILALSSCLSLNVIASGIETKSEFRFLQQLGCHQGQGPYFSKALPARKLTALLNNKAHTITP